MRGWKIAGLLGYIFGAFFFLGLQLGASSRTVNPAPGIAILTRGGPSGARTAPGSRHGAPMRRKGAFRRPPDPPPAPWLPWNHARLVVLL